MRKQQVNWKIMHLWLYPIKWRCILKQHLGKRLRTAFVIKRHITSLYILSCPGEVFRCVSPICVCVCVRRRGSENWHFPSDVLFEWPLSERTCKISYFYLVSVRYLRHIYTGLLSENVYLVDCRIYTSLLSHCIT